MLVKYSAILGWAVDLSASDEKAVLLQSGIRYPVVVRFNTVNYAGVSTNNYGLEEVEQL